MRALAAVALSITCASASGCGDDTGASVVVTVTNAPAGVSALDVSVTVGDQETHRVFDGADTRAALADGEATFAIAIADDDRNGTVSVGVRALAGDCAVASGAGQCQTGACDELTIVLDALAPPDCPPDTVDAGVPDGGLNDGRPDAS